MKRRSILTGSLGVAALATGAGVLWRPEDKGSPHDAYFSKLNTLLKRKGPGRPVMLIDTERMNHNIDVLTNSVGPNKTYRVVVKSLPSVPLLQHVMQRAKTDALMVFHQPFLNAIAEAFPRADTLIGKPLPVNAVRSFYHKSGNTQFNAERQVQWLVDTPTRLLQYQALARELGIKMRINLELDVGLHRGGFEIDAFDSALKIMQGDSQHLQFAGFMGYEPHLTGQNASLEEPSVQKVLNVYRGFQDKARSADIKVDQLTMNGAGSHTLRIYQRDNTMNDLSAGSGVVMPTDFDTHHLSENRPALFIATPILKRYDDLIIPGDPWFTNLLPKWNPNMQRLYYIYGGYWKARMVSPPGVPEPLYRSTNQSPVMTSKRVDLQVDDYMFLRPTQSEHVMLQFGDLLAVDNGEFVDRWPVFHQSEAEQHAT